MQKAQPLSASGAGPETDLDEQIEQLIVRRKIQQEALAKLKASVEKRSNSRMPENLKKNTTTT